MNPAWPREYTALPHGQVRLGPAVEDSKFTEQRAAMAAQLAVRPIRKNPLRP